MVDWRRNNQFDNNYRDTPTTSARSQNKKPPTGPWQPSVPQWEKKFCTMVGSVPWGKIVEAKKMMSYYDNVVQWNDSAGEEAFHNAKSRFWAEINGLPCDISLPDPNTYIDDIDWHSKIDPELILDLDRAPMAPDNWGREGKAGFEGSTLVFMNKPVPCTGWGDADEDLVRTANDSSPGTGVRDDNNYNSINEDRNPWECSQPVESSRTGWGDAEEDPIRARNNVSSGAGYRDRSTSSERNPWDMNLPGDNLASEHKKWGEKSWAWKQWGNNSKESDGFDSRRTGGGWGQWEGNWRKREGATQNMSRYKTSRFQSDDQYELGGGWKNGGRGRKRVNFAYERPLIDKKPFVQRPWNPVHQIGHHGSAEAGNNLWRSWDKQVS
ncbi:hypothetical protein MKX03_001876 [Papaver bracteatum]|nr:hypothetical protein MKX03_001876 [Papaver bracteatum]